FHCRDAIGVPIELALIADRLDERGQVFLDPSERRQRECGGPGPGRFSVKHQVARCAQPQTDVQEFSDLEQRERDQELFDVFAKPEGTDLGEVEIEISDDLPDIFIPCVDYVSFAARYAWLDPVDFHAAARR